MSTPCVIFDFDGVIANTEELHLTAYNQSLIAAREIVGRLIHISPERYFSRYIVFGNVEGFRQILHDHGIDPSPSLLDELCRLKDNIMDGRIGESPEPLPGISVLLQHLATRRVTCAICSGARRIEISGLLKTFALEHHFPVIISIEDVKRGKPDPQGYALAFDRLNDLHNDDLDKARSLVIEDTEGGAMAAHAAGLRVLGVATTSHINSVQKWADFAFENLQKLPLHEVDQQLGLSTGG